MNKALINDDPNSKGVGKTTIYEDLKDIEYRIFNGEIERIKEGRKTYLRYADPRYSISNHPLNEMEIIQLKAAISVLARFKGLPQFEWMNEIIPILEGKLGLVNLEAEIISFEENIDYSGKEYIPTIFNAIVSKRVLKILYQDFKSLIAYEVELHPYYLKQHNSRWFVFGFNSSKPYRIQNLALDRIKEINEIPIKFQPTQIDWDDYFSDIIGVTKNDSKIIEIKLLIIDEEQAAYIQTKPLHQSQKPIRKTESGFETSIQVIPNYELEKLILSFGERVKVISPRSFQEKLLRRVVALYKVYNK